MGRMGGQAVKGDAGEAKGHNRGRGLGGAPRAGGLGRKDGGGRGRRNQPSWQQWSLNRSYLCSRREGLWLQGSCGIGAGGWGGAHRMAAWAWLAEGRNCSRPTGGTFCSRSVSCSLADLCSLLPCSAKSEQGELKVIQASEFCKLRRSCK